MSRRRVVIVGGGITGLATAWRLKDDADVTVIEANCRFGGAIRTIDFDGVPFDVGADAMLARQPHARALVRDIGFGDHDLVAPASSQVLLWRGRRLRRLPEHTMLGAPSDLLALARSSALPPHALARAALEPLLARGPIDTDVSVGEFVGRRFGHAIVDTLVEPLLGGVYAGRADRLSLQSAAAPLWHIATTQRSLLRGLAASRQAQPSSSEPVFLTIRDGLGRIVDRLVTQLGDRARSDIAVTNLERTDGAWNVALSTGEQLAADDVVLTVSPTVSRALLADIAPQAAVALREIPIASIAVVALAYVPVDAAHLPQSSGLLVPRTAGKLVKAATFSSMKWPQHANHPRVLMRASVGRVDDDRHRYLDDESLARQVDNELREMLRLRAPAVRSQVIRWPDALPQYDVGHETRVTQAQQVLADQAPGVHLAGASIGGVGIAARCAQAEVLADKLRTGV